MPCMLNSMLPLLSFSGRIRRVTSAARSPADTTANPRPIVPRFFTTATKQGSGWFLCASPEQPTEPLLVNKARSHSQERDRHMMLKKEDALLVGIDVSKAALDVARSDVHEVSTFANDATGIALLVKVLRPLSPTMIVVEATGGLEQPVITALLDGACAVARVNPAQVRHLAKALGIQAKTDPIDARVLVAFARHAQPRLLEKRSKTSEELEALVTCRRQLLKTRTEQTNRLGTTRTKIARRAIEAVLKILDQQIAKLDVQIRKMIDHDDDLSCNDRILRSAPGVGPILSATLLCELTELGRIDRRQVGSLVGVAPFNRDSGRWRGKRSIRGGRASVRSTLYMATLAAIRCNPVIRRFAERLKAAGKCNKVILPAAMRKFLTILNAMLRDRIEWSQLKLVQNA